MKLALALTLLGLAFGLVGSLACSDRDRPQIAETERHNRVVDPPAKPVRALPPHAIHADGIGPYKLGASLSDLNDLLRSGPHLAQIDIPHVIRVTVLRAEQDDAVLIGGEPQGKATFVSVVGEQVARTESGIHVGSTRADVTRELGAPQVEPERARDPHVVVPMAMPELRLVFDGDRVIGLVVAPRDTSHDAKDAKDASDACIRPTVDGSDTTHIRFGACLSGVGSGSADIVTVDNDELAIRTQDDKPLAALTVHNLAFAAPIRAPDGRDELYIVTRVDEPSASTWSIAGYRLDGTRLVPVGEPKAVYQLTAANARWIGSDLHDLDLYLDLTSRADGIEVGGLLTTRMGASLRDLLVLAPVQVPRAHRKSPSGEANDAGIPDAAPAHEATP